MAASGHEKPRGSKGKNHNHGVRIDSSLINTASSGSDVQSELSGLGVSVYNQEEFEAGVLQQIDQEVSKRNAEQQRKFLLKEYNLVKHEISGVRLELNNLSKSIAGLLSCRLCDVVLDLRKLRASQDQKRKQLRSLETRELQLLRKVSGKDDAGDSGQLGEKSIPDVAFGIALGNQSSEQQRLIQTGQLTPFGGRVEETTPGDGTTDTLSKTPVELISGECSVTGPIPSCSASAGDFHEADITSSSNSPPSSVHTDGSFAIAETLTLSKHVTPRQGKIGSQGRGLLKLSTDSFDGLFADPVSSLPATQSVKKSGGKLENGGKSRKGKERVKPTQQGGSTSVLRSHKKVADSEVWESLSEGLSLTGPTPNGGGWMPSEVEEGESGETDSRDWMPSVVEEWESGETDGGDWLPSVVEEGESGETNSGDWLPSTVEEGESGETDGGAWMPSTVEEGESGETDGGTWMPSMVEEEESEESEYYTDEELGGEGVSGVEGKSRRKRNLRELSSDDSDGELLGYGRRCKRLVSSAVRLGKHQDDGDEELYRMRIGQYEEGKEEEENQDRPVATFEGGLRVPGSIWSKLYRYQQTGVKWLWELHCQQAGGIVGDEMGLGKTIQMIAFLAGLRESNLRSHVTRKLGLGPVLIVCPATVMHQWVSEFHTWWPPFRVAVLHETGTFVGHKRILVDRIVAGDGVLITTYAGMRTYRDLLLGCKWDYVILDEGHKIRNPDAEMTLACKQFTTPHRLILSGSPMQNNLRELWSLFDFVFPGKLGTLPVFMEQFSVPITLGGYANATEVQVQTAYRCACVLRDTINPYLLRRLKADVKIQLPNKNEQVLFCRLTDYQRELYEDFIHSPGVERMLAVRKRVFSGLMTLRKLCNHPDLVTNDYSELITNEKGEEEEDFEIINISGRKKKKKRKSLCGGEGLESEEVYGYWQRSGKMVVVESLLKLWKAQGHRVLLFTQSKQMLNILERFVSSRGYSYQRMDGGTSISARQPLINKFNQDPSIFVFILTTRVGGLGVNLVGGNRVLIYDPDWNPSTDTQARERAWRIGQTRQVTVYRLLTSGTIEEKIYHRQIFKQFLTNRVLKDPRQRRFFKANNLHELFSLGSSASEGSTETSAIFAGTGSEVLPSRKRMSHERSHDHRKERIPLAGSKRQSHNTNEDSKPKKRRKKERVHFEISLVDSNKGSCGPPESGDEVENTVMETQVSESSQPGTSAETSRSVLDQQASTSTFEMECEPVSSARTEPVQSSPGNGQQSASSPIAVHKKKCRGKHKGKKASSKKKAGRKQQQNAVVEDAEITGVERTGIFEAGDGDALTSKQDDFILKKLFRKSGVHAAMQHDTIMNSSDPDYVLVESEAKKVAQSAARAMKQSRQHCMVAGRLGRPTWTGQHGMTGAPTPQFGSKGKSSTASAQVQSSSHFDGKSANSSSWRKGSLNTSSHVLLARMKSRNTHELPTGGSSGLHQDTHDGLLREMREFIATQCKVDGQATTGEILDRFSCRLPSSSTAVFRSLLHEICDFSRYHGDGMWTLKSGFR